MYRGKGYVVRFQWLLLNVGPHGFTATFESNYSVAVVYWVSLGSDGGATVASPSLFFFSFFSLPIASLSPPVGFSDLRFFFSSVLFLSSSPWISPRRYFLVGSTLPRVFLLASLLALTRLLPPFRILSCSISSRAHLGSLPLIWRPNSKRV